MRIWQRVLDRTSPGNLLKDNDLWMFSGNISTKLNKSRVKLRQSLLETHRHIFKPCKDAEEYMVGL